MNNVNINKDDSIKLLKNFIKDLSFENPQNIEENNVFQISNSDLNINMNVFYRPYNNNNFFSLLLRFNLECFSEENKRNLFNIELDYFGFFEILEHDHNQKLLTEKGTKLLFPYAKEIIENITQKGGSVPVLLREIDFELKKS